MSTAPMGISKNKIVLIGGGHTHALVLKAWRDQGLKLGKDFGPITLISDSPRSPYSGRLTGYIAGLYSEDEVYLDIKRLAESAGASFVCGSVVDVDVQKKTVFTSRGESVPYDVLSLNVGGTPRIDTIKGADEFAVPVKPIGLFQKAFTAFLDQAVPSAKPINIVQIGGGVAGIECALGFESRCRRIGLQATVTLIEASADFLPAESRWTRNYILGLLSKRGIQVRLDTKVSEITNHQITLDSGDVMSADFIAISTGVTTAAWVQNLRLKQNDGFIEIDEYLQTSIPGVFAAGDVAQNPSSPIPRAGVYAVRQAPVLSRNLLKSQGADLVRFKPQREYLKLIMDGCGRAIAVRGWFLWPNSKFGWWLKDRIDRNFMRQF